MRTTSEEQHNMSDSDFGFDGGDSDLDFGFDASASSSDDEEVVNTSSSSEDVLVKAHIDASGKMLLPLLVFKGAKNGRIVKKEFPTFDNSMYYTCQENAWMDE